MSDPTQVEAQELFHDMLSNVILDVRQSEAALLSETARLRLENRTLQASKDRAVGILASVSAREGKVGRREAATQARGRALDAREERLAARERLHKKATSVTVKDSVVERRCVSAVLNYMVRCEELLGQPEGAAAARDGLSERSAVHDVELAIPQHLEEIQSAFENKITTLQAELRLVTDRLEAAELKAARDRHQQAVLVAPAVAEASASANGAAAARVRERKAKREAKELQQAMATIEGLNAQARSKSRVAALAGSELDMIATIIEATKARIFQ